MKMQAGYQGQIFSQMAGKKEVFPHKPPGLFSILFNFNRVVEEIANTQGRTLRSVYPESGIKIDDL